MKKTNKRRIPNSSLMSHQRRALRSNPETNMDIFKSAKRIKQAARNKKYVAQNSIEHKSRTDRMDEDKVNTSEKSLRLEAMDESVGTSGTLIGM